MKYRNLIVAAALAVALLVVGALALGSRGEENGDKPQHTGQLVITEICAKNETVIPANDGKYRDYIELYAPAEAVSLKGFTLTDGKVTSEPLGDITIGAGEYRVLFLGDDTTGFALGATGGDTVQLKAPNGAIAAQANTTAMGQDQVMLLVDGKFTLSSDASPNFPNTAEGLASFRQGSVQNDPRLVISEVLISNESTRPDELGIYSDVIELHNVSGEALLLSNFFLSDDAACRYAYRLPGITLEAGGYLVIYCDSEGYENSQGYIHANFGLSRGESVYLTDATGAYLQAQCQSLGEDISWQLDGSGQFVAGVPSIGFANTDEGIDRALQSRTNPESPLIISEVVLSTAGVPYEGVISDYIEITNRSNATVSTEGWFICDGGDPYDYPLPATKLKSGESLVLRCDYTGCGFGLSQGETLMLTGPDFRHAPLVTCAEAEPGLGLSSSDNQGELTYGFAPVSLGFANTAQGQESFLLAQQSSALVISEVMTSNLSYLRGPYGAACDWIELYNAGKENIELSGYTLSDNDKYPGKYQLPQRTLAPGEYCVIILTADPDKARSGYAVVPMELSSMGEGVYLSKDGLVADFVLIPELETDAAYGRAQGSSAFSQLEKPTPGKTNSKTAAVSSDPVAVTAPGKYEGVEYVEVELSAPGTIYYTTNGSIPGRGSRKYTGPIRLTETTALRVVCYEEGKRASNVVDLLYAVNEGDSLPIVSVMIEPGDLWGSDRGIYAAGPNASAEYPYYGANYHQNWERAASVSLYENDGTGFSQKCGLKIFGGYSRGNDKKSFACMFRKSYGKGQLDYPVFGEDSLPYYEALVLRAGGQETSGSRFKDEMITSFAGEYLGLAVQDYRPVALYLNGEYWGVYFIREKINEHYVAGNFGVEPETVDLGHWDGSDSAAFYALKTFARRNDLTKQENYDYVLSQIDVENYTDFMIAQIWISNRDPGNVKFFSAPGYKWTWIFFDTDLAFIRAHESTLGLLMNSSLGFDITTRTFAVKLLENPQYRDYFMERMAWQMSQVWTEENLIPHIDGFYQLLSQDMQKECKRWGTSYAAWEKQVEQLRQFARERNGYLLGQLQSRFGLTREQMVAYGFPVE